MPEPVRKRRRVFDEVIGDAVKDGDDPAVVAKTIVTAATDKKSKPRYTAGPPTSRLTTVRRLVPAGPPTSRLTTVRRLVPAGPPASRLTTVRRLVPAGPPASRVTTVHRLVPAGTFDEQIRKNNRLPT
ncbi:hypothetical protein JIX56_00880 [Streptomyces sp. CA-210063]|uniref:hypothetical protein n=1 Tax=Streptomyces sp. CA-210063 TaxID=2801029 RepID=UPI00214CD187|nr:hypothetical protein [Streptomyces sp. CA-210063]UUU28570.1 hypothetical protein JIX56_00880 [Streptomyces sp. CA-210063]